MPIPALNSHGLLPSDVHDCTLSEIEISFGWNKHRKCLLEDFNKCMKYEIRSVFTKPLYFDGSFVTDKEKPDDIDVVLDLCMASDSRKWKGLDFMLKHQSRLKNDYNVHFWINLPSNNDFSIFFQYVGVKTAKLKGLVWCNE
jgi:hypothetical protein